MYDQLDAKSSFCNSMKFQILSDLHNEFSIFEPPEIQVDGVILTGDIDLGVKGAYWAIEKFKNIPIIYIAGNHEYYRNKLPEINCKLIEISKTNTNFFFLENDAIIFDGIKFLGCTLWSDFLLFGQENFGISCDNAEQLLSDFFHIRLGASNSYRKFRAADSIRMHKQSIVFLEDELFTNHQLTTVILTHHAPLINSIPRLYRSDLLSSAFASNLEGLIKKYKPDFWIHGHTHFNVDYFFDETRIVSNQRGYYPIELAGDFKEDFVIEIN